MRDEKTKAEIAGTPSTLLGVNQLGSLYRKTSRGGAPRGNLGRIGRGREGEQVFCADSEIVTHNILTYLRMLVCCTNEDSFDGTRGSGRKFFVRIGKG